MRAVLVLALILGMSGCIRAAEPVPEAADAAPSPDALAAATTPGPATGRLVITVRMPDLSPLPSTTVVVGNLTQLTDTQGIARFESLAPGPYNVSARKEAHRTAQLEVEVRAGETTEAEAVLAALVEGDQHAHETGLLAHRDLYAFEGSFDCSATYVIITGDCLIVVDNVTTTAGVPPPADPTSERNVIDFPLDRTWVSLVVEMTWTATAPTPATGSEMTLALEPAEAPADGHAAKYARAYGEGPLRIELSPGEAHEMATLDDMPNPEGGEVIRARAYVAGLGNRPAGTDFLGVGAAKDQKFTILVSIFYGEAAPTGYSALGSAG